MLTGGTRLVLIGIALGLPAAWVASRSVESMLFGLTPTNPVAIGGAIVLLTTAAQLAAARRPSRGGSVDGVAARMSFGGYDRLESRRHRSTSCGSVAPRWQVAQLMKRSCGGSVRCRILESR